MAIKKKLTSTQKQRKAPSKATSSLFSIKAMRNASEKANLTPAQRQRKAGSRVGSIKRKK